MWICLPYGYFSIVAKGKINQFCIRSRNKDHLLLLCDDIIKYGGKPTKVSISRGTDYPYRIWIDQEEWAHCLKEIMLAVDYDNFKSEAKYTNPKDHVYHSFLSKIWSLSHDLTKRAKNEKPDFTFGWYGGNETR